MPIKSTKPAPGRFIPSKPTPPTPSDFNAAQRQMDRMAGPVSSNLQASRSDILTRTQPYQDAGRLREGEWFRVLQDEKMLREIEGRHEIPARIVERMPLVVR